MTAAFMEEYGNYRWIVLLTVGVFLIALLSAFFALLINNHRLKLRVTELEHTVLELDKTMKRQRLQLMQNQIRPHFIFNMLLAIKQLCIEDPKLAAESLLHFSKYLRMNLDALSGDQLVPFSRELECIKEYIALEQADPSSGFRIDYDIQYDQFYLPLLTVQPMVENAVRHGIASRRGSGIIKVKTYLENETIMIIIEDNGTGYGSETRQQAEHRSIGLKNVIERLKLLCKGELSIINTGKGTVVRISIPKQKDEAVEKEEPSLERSL